MVNRLIYLDGLRGVLAMIVVLVHIGRWTQPPAWSHRFIAIFGDAGTAVDAFFMLSGLVIFRSVASFAGQPAPFMLARAARIYPPYLITLAVAVVFVPPALPWDALGIHLLTHVTLLHGLVPQAVMPNEHLAILNVAWSLSTEWQFYVVASLLMAAGWAGPVSASVLFTVIAVAGLWAGRGFSISFLPNQAHLFAIGIMTGVVLRRHTTRELAVCAAAFAACLLVIALRGAPTKFLPVAGWTVVVAAQRFPTAGLLSPVRAVLGSAPLQWLGKVSYSLYLIHVPLIYAVLRLGIADATGRSVVTVAASLAAAWAMQRWVEAPLARSGSRAAKRWAATAMSGQAEGRA